MNAPIHKVRAQLIEQDGKPVFAVIPYEDYLRLFDDDQATVPHEVVELVVKKGYNLARAWRENLRLTQREVAKRAGITQSAVSQMERTDNRLNNESLEKLARAMGISVEQLTD